MNKILSLILCVFLISGCSKASTNHIKKDLSLSGINEITYEPILNSYLEENEGTYLYYFNIKEIRDASKKEDATKEEKKLYENISKELDIKWTPVLKLVNKGETISEYTYLSEEYYEIKGSKKKEQAKEKYIDDFKDWMSNIYE